MKHDVRKIQHFRNTYYRTDSGVSTGILCGTYWHYLWHILALPVEHTGITCGTYWHYPWRLLALLVAPTGIMWHILALPVVHDILCGTYWHYLWHPLALPAVPTGITCGTYWHYLWYLLASVVPTSITCGTLLGIRRTVTSQLNIPNKSSANVTKCKYVGANVTSHNYIHGKMKCKMNSKNANCTRLFCYLDSGQSQF